MKSAKRLFIDMSGVCRTRTPPACPLATHLALPNRVLGGGACTAWPRTHSLSCGCDFAVRSESIGCLRAPFPLLRRGPLSASARRAHFRVQGSSLQSFLRKANMLKLLARDKKIALREDAEGTYEMGRSARAADRSSSTTLSIYSINNGINL